MKPETKTIYVAQPHGFCAGVRRALDIADLVLQKADLPVYCLKEIVHNRMVVENLRGRGIVFVDSIEEAPRGATILFSAHGVSPAVRAKARELDLNIIDATCPFVNKVHTQVRKFAETGHTILLLGYLRHDEIIGVAGEAPDQVKALENEEQAKLVQVKDPGKVALMTQTTLSIKETQKVYSILSGRFPKIQTAPRDCICYATTNRQKAVSELSKKCGIIFVLGSHSSSNTRRLAEVAAAHGSRSKVIESLEGLKEINTPQAQDIGITAGASTPEQFVDDVLKFLLSHGFARVENVCVAEENISFRIPSELRSKLSG